jgi:hypothetical protein
MDLILMDFLDRWMYKFMGRKVPVIKIVEVGENGYIKSLVFSRWVRRANSLLETWNTEGAEISPNHEGMLTLTDESGLTQPAYAEYKGRTCNLYIQPRKAPNIEKVIGAGATIDDIASALDLYPSMRDKLIFMFIGIALGWLIVGPMITTMLS